ncbi:MAG: hypothetical protein LUC83_06405 [Clostridiales bacterium]|nr:hypothetical protein [Clostridiales bacterium]
MALWYHSILPVLLPFCVFSNIIVKSGMYDRLFERLYPAFRIFYPIRSPLIYPLIAGFLFGFPLGSKICADLYHAGKISSEEAEAVSCISNNFGPAFLYNYLYQNIFRGQISIAAVYAACYLPPLLLGRIKLTRHTSGEPIPESTKPTSGSSINIKILDAGILDGFTTMIKLAGYIVLSALLADIILHIPFENAVIQSLCIGLTEVTNGIQRISELPPGNSHNCLLAIGIVNLGEISGLSQTYSVMKGTGFRIRRYLRFKLMCSLIGMLTMQAFLLLQNPIKG